MSLRAEMKQILTDLLLEAPPGRNEIAHFCTHAGIRIQFSRARTTWLALTPSGIKPWCMLLEPLRPRSNVNNNKLPENNNKEVTENA